eukprot:s143_g14.t1
MEFPDSQPIFEPWPDVTTGSPPNVADRQPIEAAPDDFDENDKDDGRLPLTCIPWPIWQTTEQRLAEADKLVEELEKKTGPLGDNVLQVLSEALELEQEEQQLKNDVRDEDEDPKPKKVKGKKKKKGQKSQGHHDAAECETKAKGKDEAGECEENAGGKDEAAGCEDEARGKDDAAGCDHAQPDKGVKRRLVFDEYEEAGDEPWPEVKAVGANKMSWVPVCTK